MNTNIEIPAGYRKLNSDELVIEGDKFAIGGEWEFSNNWNCCANGAQWLGYTYIRRLGNDKFQVGDKVVVGGIEGTIHSPRFYLTTGYGYVVKFTHIKYQIINWDFAGIGFTGDLITFRETLIKPAPKTKEVKLNSEYSAIVSKDTIKVGCQTIPYEAVKEIVKAHDSLTA